MSGDTIYSTMLNMITNTLPSAFIVLDGDDRVVEFRISRRQRAKSRLIGRPLFRILFYLFERQVLTTVQNAVLNCRKQGAPITVKKMQILTQSGEAEYFNWNFYPVTDSGYITIFVQNQTESTLIEEEFNALCESQDSINRELCVAISKLDFQYMDLEQAHKKLAALYRITSVVQRTVVLPEIFNEIINGLTQQLGYVNVAIFLLEEETGQLVIKAHQGYSDDISLPVTQGNVGYAVTTRETIYVPDITKDPRYVFGTSKGVSEVAIPLIVDDKVIGVLDVETPEGRIIKDYDLDLLRSLGSQIALTIAHAKHVANVEVQAVTDSLTSLFNYRYFRSVLEQEFKRAVRYARPLSMLMIDIDNYKQYNDTHGHRMGDEVLRGVANILKESVRDVDIVARYGGEEFTVICPETFLDEAKIIAERIRYNIEKYPFANKHTQPGGALTVSIGVAAYPRDAANADELIDHADLSLYKAKRYTKNCVWVFGSQINTKKAGNGIGL